MSTYQKSLLDLDGIYLNFSEGSLTVMNVILAFVMFGIALRMNVTEFKDVVKKPKSFIVGVFYFFYKAANLRLDWQFAHFRI